MSATTQCRISRRWVVQGFETAWWPSAEVSWSVSSSCTSGSWRLRNWQRDSWKGKEKHSAVSVMAVVLDLVRFYCVCNELFKKCPNLFTTPPQFLWGNTSTTAERCFVTCGCGDYICLWNFSNALQFTLQSNKNDEHFTWRLLYVSAHNPSLNF
jgi:hypothetical protein